MTTFEHQKELAKLPIPPLEDTINRYLEVLEPLQTKDEHAKTIDACSEFLKSTGPILQEQLIQYSKTRDSYIEQFWFDSYLNYDSPVVLNLNPFIMIEDDPIPGDRNWISRGTELVSSTLRFINALRNKTLPVDYVRGKQPLDMDQYLRLFGSARIPTNNGCVLQTDKNSKHIVVIVNSQFYWFNVLDDDNNLLLTQDQIRLNLKSIIEDSKSIDSTDIAKSSFGILTTENRRVWFNLRTNLKSDPTNRSILKTIDAALFCLVLDDIDIGEDLDQISQNFLCGKSLLDNGIQVGTCTNRWYDKLQLIITRDGKSGINFEHTGVDGHTVLRFASDIYTDSILRFARTINKDAPSIFNDSMVTSSKAENAEPPRKLEWNLTNELSLALRFAETRLSDLINQNEFSTLNFRNFGMERIKKMGMSPDAFVQMSFQLTYYSLYGKIECTYEPAMTKKFLHGRTEAIRTVSKESNEFVTKFLDNDISSKEKIDLLKKACKKHSERTRGCAEGLGQDRHLYALFCIWKRYYDTDDGNTSDIDSSDESTIDFDRLPHTVDSVQKLKEIPSIFADEGWNKLNTTILSTSNCGNPSLKIFGFGPVSENGFGLGYIIKDNRITICASSKHRQTARFTSCLETTLDLMERTYREAFEESRNDQVKLLDTEKLLGGYPAFKVDFNSDAIKSSDQEALETKLFTAQDIGRKLRLSEY